MSFFCYDGKKSADVLGGQENWTAWATVFANSRVARTDGTVKRGWVGQKESLRSG